MITIGKSQDWYRPYELGKYTIKNIRIYDENGVIIETGCGWLEYNNIDLDRATFDVDDIPLKRKVDFNIKGAFYISQGKAFVGNELEAVLYLHKDIVQLQFTGYRKIYDSIRKYYQGKTADNQLFEISSLAKYLKDDYWEHRNKLESLLKGFENNISDLDQKKLNKYLADIKEIGNELIKEQRRLDKYSVEDYLQDK